MREKIIKFMQGRHGIDEFSNFLIVIALVILVIEFFIPVSTVRTVFQIITLLLMLYSYFRILSKNQYKRHTENERYLKYHNKVLRYLSYKKLQKERRRTHCVFKCPSCKQSIRVPRGKGKIAITCPKCSTEFIRRS